MDAGKIKSVTSRADASGHASARRPDTGLAAARVVSAFLLDASSDAGESGALTEGASAAVPRDGIVVNLSRGIVAAEKDLQLARSAMRAADYTYLDPKSAPASRAAIALASAPDAMPGPADVVSSAMLAGGSVAAQNAERAGAAPAATGSNATPDLRPDLYPHGHAMAVTPNPVAAEQKTAASAVSQARDAERLAGLTVTPAAIATPTETHLGKLILGAIALGVLVVILL
jgi:hypothetical protein